MHAKNNKSNKEEQSSSNEESLSSSSLYDSDPSLSSIQASNPSKTSL